MTVELLVGIFVGGLDGVCVLRGEKELTSTCGLLTTTEFVVTQDFLSTMLWLAD